MAAAVPFIISALKAAALGAAVSAGTTAIQGGNVGRAAGRGQKEIYNQFSSSMFYYNNDSIFCYIFLVIKNDRISFRNNSFQFTFN